MILELDAEEWTMREVWRLADALDEVGLTGLHVAVTVTLDCPDDRVEQARQLARYCLIGGRFDLHACKPCDCAGGEAT